MPPKTKKTWYKSPAECIATEEPIFELRWASISECKAVYVGIDPGKHGGVAVISRDGVHSWSLAPLSLEDQWEWFKFYSGRPKGSVIVALEKVGGYVGGDDSEGRARGSNMFTFGASYGALRAFVIAAGLDYVEVAPRAWMKTFDMMKEKGETKTAWKSRLHAVACTLFQGVTTVKAAADALLIAEHLRRTKEPRRVVERV